MARAMNKRPFSLLERASRASMASAQHALAGIFLFGEQIEQDLVISYAWMTLAKENEYEEAADDLEEIKLHMTFMQVAKDMLLTNKLRRQIAAKTD